MNAYEIYKLLRDGYPFIFRISSNEIKYIGMTAFRDCTEEEKMLFGRYCEELKRIQALRYTADENEARALVETFNRILASGDAPFNENKSRECHIQFYEYIQHLTEEELESLSEQHKDLLEVYDYRDGAFYRHAKDK